MPWPSITDRYIIGIILRPLGIAIFIGLMVLLSERFVRVLDQTLGKKNSIAVVFELLSYLIPHYLGLAIPASIFLGLLFGFNRLSKDSEIDAFMATGFSLARLNRSVVIMAVVFASISLGLYGWFQPYARYAYNALLFSVKNVEVFYLAEEGVFMQAGTRTFILDKLQRKTNNFERIFLFDYRGAGGTETITAQRGSLIAMKGDPRPILRLDAGHRLKIDGWPDLSGSSSLPLANSGEFASVDTPLGKVAGTIFRHRGGDGREMTLLELLQNLANPPKGTTHKELVGELNKRLVFSVSVIILPFLALPFAIGTRRSQRAYRFAIALIILVAYHEILEQGAVASRANATSPLLTMWLPFMALGLFSAWRYWNTCYRLEIDRLQPVYDRFAAVGDAIADGLRKSVGIGRP